MYRLTKMRLQKAKPILEKYLAQLNQRYAFDVGGFESELKECWNLGYQELKGIAEDMSKNDRYRYLAIYYMEHSNTPGIVSEFQPLLAKAYGISWYYDTDREKKQVEFWAAFKANVGRNAAR